MSRPRTKRRIWRALLPLLGAATIATLLLLQPQMTDEEGATTPVMGETTDRPGRITGEFSVYDEDAWRGDEGNECSGLGGYSDIQAGTQVVVTNGRGEVIATGALRGGTLQATAQDRQQAAALAAKTPDDYTPFSERLRAQMKGLCVFSVLVPDVPDSDFYAIEVSHRGEQVMSRAELDRESWEIHLGLGQP